MKFYDEKEKKTIGSSTLSKTGKMATSLFHPQNGYIAVSCFQKTRKKRRTVKSHWDSVFLVNWRGEKTCKIKRGVKRTDWTTIQLLTRTEEEKELSLYYFHKHIFFLKKKKKVWIEAKYSTFRYLTYYSSNR